jgi:hypothetical protein
MESKPDPNQQRRIGKDLWNQCRVQLPAAGRCPEAGLLAAYLDRGLTENENSGIEAHLVKCRVCLDTLLFLREIDNDLLAAVAEKDLLAACNLVTPVRAPLAGVGKRLSGWFCPLPLSPIFASAFLILVCLTGFYLGNRTGTDRMFVKNALVTELQFGLDHPLVSDDSDREEG